MDSHVSEIIIKKKLLKMLAQSLMFLLRITTSPYPTEGKVKIVRFLP